MTSTIKIPIEVSKGNLSPRIISDQLKVTEVPEVSHVNIVGAHVCEEYYTQQLL